MRSLHRAALGVLTIAIASFAAQASAGPPADPPTSRHLELRDDDAARAAARSRRQGRADRRRSGRVRAAGPSSGRPRPTTPPAPTGGIPGTRHLANRRTSLIVDPPDGRLPPLTPEAQARAAARAQAPA